jgi:hypothetical protein
MAAPAHPHTLVVARMSEITINVEPFRPEPGDIIVAKVQGRLSMDQIQRIGTILKERFPDHQVAVLDEGIELHAVSGAVASTRSHPNIARG